MNTKSTTGKIGKYFREISVVVMGVAITLSASYWIGVKKEKRDMALHLYAIKMELEENVKDVSFLINVLKPELRYTAYLRSHDKKSLDKDTLKSYFYVCYTISPTVTFKANAFEMFKNSGTMRLMNDRELLMAIWTAYDELTLLKQVLDEHNKLRWNFIEKEASFFDVDVKGEIELNTIPMYDFYKKIGGYTTIMMISERFLRNIEKMILRLEELEMLKQFESAEFKPFDVTDEDLDKYLGVYSNDTEPVKMTITKANKKLVVQATGQPPISMEAIAENKFKIRAADIIFEFNPTDKTMAVEEGGKIFNFVRED